MSRSPGWARATTSHGEGGRVPPFIEKLQMPLLKKNFFGFFIIAFLLPASIGWCRTLVATGTYGAVSTGHPMASKAAIKMLGSGGNAVDAAVGAAMVMGVVDPSNSGLGGDGHALVFFNQKLLAFDASSFRPPAPMGSCTIGIPRAGHLLLNLHKNYGVLSLPQVMAPAIRAAQRGFKISPYFSEILRGKFSKIADFPAFRRFSKAGRPLMPGELLFQPELEETLIRIAQDQGRSFLKGGLGREILAELGEKGSRYSWPDWVAAVPKNVEPIRVKMKEWEIAGVPPPSSGIIVAGLVEKIINFPPSLNRKNWQKEFIKEFRRVLNIRYQKMPKLISDPGEVLRIIRSKTPFSEGLPDPRKSTEVDGETTHLVVWDKDGNIVSMTITLGSHFGSQSYSKFGFFYNDQMMHFKDSGFAFENYPKRAGSITSKSPMLVFKDGKPVLSIGGAGGNKIVANLAQIIGKFVAGDRNIPELVTEPRIFCNYQGLVGREWFRGIEASGKLFEDRPEKIYPPGDDFFGLISAVGKIENLIAVGDFRRDGAAEALLNDPERERMFRVEGFLWSAKGIKEFGVITPPTDERQKTGHWKIMDHGFRMEAKPKTRDFSFPLKSTENAIQGVFHDTDDSRDGVRLFSKRSALRIKQIVRIKKLAKDDRNYESFNSPLRDNFVELSPQEKEFIEEIPKSLSVRELIEWLMVEIGWRIPYRRVKGIISARELLDAGEGDCSGKARLLRNALLTLGIPCRLVRGVILKDGMVTKGHAWNEVYFEGKWVPVCVVHQYFGAIPSNWLVLGYGEIQIVEGDGTIFFRVKEL